MTNPLRSFALCSLVLPLLFLNLACKPNLKKKAPQAGDKVSTVSVFKAKSEEIQEALEFKGNFIPTDKLDVRAEADGKVVSVAVNEGQTVTSGEALAVLNPEILQLTLEKSRRELKEIEAKIDAGITVDGVENSFSPQPDRNPAENSHPTPERQEPPTQNSEAEKERNLDEVGEEMPPPPPPSPPSTPPSSVNNLNPSANNQIVDKDHSDRAETLMRVNQTSADRIRSEIALLEKKIEAANVTSGIEGMVAKRNITEGSVVVLGDILFQIIRMDPVLFSIEVGEDSITHFKKEDKVQVVADNIPGEGFSGEIVFESPEPDPQSKKYEIKIALPNPQTKIKAGMTGQLLVSLNKTRKGLMIPWDCLFTDGKKQYVYLVQDKIAQRREVELGNRKEDRVEVKSGLVEGDQVVLKGRQNLKEELEFVKVE